MDLRIVMRTLDRQIRPSYLARTVTHLRRQGIQPDQLHVYPTDPVISWIEPAIRVACTLHRPARKYRATENMGIALRDAPACDWVLHLEDDVRPCADLLGSITRWIEAHVTEDHRLLTFFAPSLKHPMHRAVKAETAVLPCPLPDAWTSGVAVALRWSDAQACGQWILDHAATWRTGPQYPAWAKHRGADKMIAAWHAEAYPMIHEGLASVPCFVEHEGQLSSLRRFGRFGFVKAPVFTGRAWGIA